MAHAPAPSSNSIIAADFGNVQTRVLLIELVEGAFTLIASVSEPSTHAFPANDPNVALMRALRRLGEMSGRRLIAGERVIIPEQANRSGADAFVATSSVGLPLRTVVMGLMPGYSLASAVRATAGTYVSIVDTLSLEDLQQTERALNAILLARPDLIFLTGGVDDGADKSVRKIAGIAAMALRLMSRDERPMVLYAGNAALSGELGAALADLTTVFTAPNVRAQARHETIAPAQLQLAAAFDALTAQRMRGFVTVGAQSRVGVLPNAQSYQLMADFLGRAGAARRNILIADIGSATSTLAASVRGHTSSTIRTDIGLGHSAATLLNAVGLDGVRPWLPFTISDNEIYDYALNKVARPAQIPDSLRALYLEHALVRAALRLLLNASRASWNPGDLAAGERPLPQFARIIGAGGALTGTGRPGMAAMLLLDALQPEGITHLELDPDALIPALGAVARFNPQTAVQLLDRRGLDDLGVCISLSGQPKPGKPAAKVKLTLPNGEVERMTVSGGELWVYPLGLGVRARVEVTALGRLNIGGKGRVRLDVVGGAAGLIIDARGRPLPLAADLKALSVQMTSWYAQATGDPIHEIQTDWLEDILMENMASAAEPPAAPARRGRRARKQAAVTGVLTPFEDSLPALDDLIAPTADAPAVRNTAIPGDEDDDLRNLLS